MTSRTTLWTEAYSRTFTDEDLDVLDDEVGIYMPWYFNHNEWIVGYRICSTTDQGTTYVRVTRARAEPEIRFELITTLPHENAASWSTLRRQLKEVLARIAEERTAPSATSDPDYTDAVVTLSEMIDARMHLGTFRSRWNPRMRPYIAAERNGMQIIDLRQTVDLLTEAYTFVRETVATGGSIMFVGTKRTVQEQIARSAAGVGMPYVNHRWPGGMLTNFGTVAARIRRLEEMEVDRDAGWPSLVTKRERTLHERETRRLERLVGGVKRMRTLPNALWVVDTNKEHLAVREAKRLGIPIVALVDTDADPIGIDYPIPGNASGLLSTGLMTSVMGDAVAEGLMGRGYSRAAEWTGDEGRVSEGRPATDS